MAGLVGVEGHIDRPGVGVLVQHAGPALAPVDGAKHAALGVGSERVADRGHQHDVGVGRVDDQGPDLAGILQADAGPGLAAVDRLVDAVAPGDVAAQGALAGADVEDVMVRRCDRDGADREVGLLVEDRRPAGSGIDRLPNPARRRAEIEQARLARHAGHRVRAAAAIGADAAPVQRLEQGRIDRRRREAISGEDRPCRDRQRQSTRNEKSRRPDQALVGHACGSPWHLAMRG